MEEWILSFKDAPEYKIERSESDFDDMSSEILNKVRSLKMDLLAYTQIDDLKPLLDENGIDIPRLRGIDTMGDKVLISKEETCELINYYTYFFIRRLTQNSYGESKYVDNKRELVIWDKLHGKRRNLAKLIAKQVKRNVITWVSAYNKYVGREDVLRVYTRLGSGNWWHYKAFKLEKEPWFLEKVDDYYDLTYCEIYVKVKEETDAI